jgi:ubiquinol-cytochrome c reductase cytochrome b subunit
VFIVFVLLFTAALFLEVPLERLADPTDNSYLPRPEWYFLFLFELLKRLQGPLEPVATVILPSIAVMLLFLLPFLTSPRLRMLNRRAVSAALVFLVFAVWGGLTLSAMLTSPENTKPSFIPSAALDWARLQPEQIAGIGYFRSSHCDSCHNLLTGNPKIGPNLALSAVRRPHEWLLQHFANPATAVSNHLGLTQLNALSIMLTSETPDSISVLQAISPEFIQGAQVYVANACASCHKINGTGAGIGPPLNGLANRRSKQWVEDHFIHPQSLSPGSIMPVFHFTPVDQGAIELYLFSLPE